MNADQLARGLHAAKEWGVPLGRAVLGLGYVHPVALYQSLARHLGLPFLDALRAPPSPACFRDDELDFYIEAEAIPIARNEGRLLLATPDPFRVLVTKATRIKDGDPVPAGEVSFVITSHLDVVWTLQSRFGDQVAQRASMGLDMSDPRNSARAGMTRSQRAWLGGLTLAVFACGIAAPFWTLAGLNVLLGGFFLAVLGLRAASIPIGVGEATARAARASVLPPPDTDLPVYTILVPLFDEARVLPLLADALYKLDYPRAKLDIKLILESDDLATIDTAKSLGLESYVEFIRVPPSLPRTKPKACNFALQFARGDFLVIFDAEDQPEPQQLKKAVAAFGLCGEDVACLQASLTYFNAGENWLTRQFTIEFNMWFDLLLPTVERLGMPIPLGGTSTHFRTSVLREAGAWDPYNVTEDADLGIRLAQKGYRCATLNSTTYEEANCHLPNWIRQRSRWFKGYVQTWLVHMRRPRALLRELGPVGFLGFHLMIGGALVSALAHPLVWIVALAGLLASGTPTAFMAAPYVPDALFALNVTLLAGGYVVSVAAGAVAVWLRGRRELIIDAPLMIFYWPIISLAAFKGLAQFITRPHFWEKTQHAISRASLAQLARLGQRRRGQ